MAADAGTFVHFRRDEIVRGLGGFAFDYFRRGEPVVAGITDSGLNGWGLPDGVYPYEDLVPADDLINVRNRIAGTRSGGTTQVAQDTASQASYGVRDDQFSSLATTDADVLWGAQSRIAKFGQPIRRIDRVTLRPIVDIPDIGMVEAGFAPQVGQQITASEQPPGFAAALTEDYQIQHVSGTITKNLFFAEVTYGLWPVADFVSPP